MIGLRRRPTTQAWLPVERLEDGALQLRDGSLRAVLECPTLAFGLKGEAEQQAVMDAWRGLLNSQPHPLQFLIRTRAIDPASMTGGTPGRVRSDDRLAALRESYANLLGGLAAERKMVSRRFFVIVPWDRADAQGGDDSGPDALEQRVSWISEWMRRIDLEPIRLRGRALAGPLYETLCWETAASQPLPDETTLADLPALLAPAALVEGMSTIGLGSREARTIAVSHYPTRLTPGWLDSLQAFEGDLDVSLHVEPAPVATVMGFLERRIAELSSTVRVSEEQGRRADPYRRAALKDAEQLQDDVAQGEERLFQASLYLTAWETNPLRLEASTRRVEALLGARLIESRRLPFQAEPGFISSLPLGLDPVGMRISLSTSALTATFPFTGNDLSQSKGQLYGINPRVRSAVMLDRFALENHNAVIFATSGAGKSFTVKTELMRARLAGIEVEVIDPEGEYAALAASLGGQVLPVRPGAPVALDAFAVPDGEAGSVSSRIATLLALIELLARGLSAGQRAAVETALSRTYAQHGYADEGGKTGQEPPTLPKIAEALGRQGAGVTRALKGEIEELRLKLGRYIEGSGRWLFASSGQHIEPSPLAVYDLAGLPEEDRAPAMFMVLDRIWSQLGRRRDPALVVVDEAWWLMQYPDTARYVFRLAKTVRKRRAGLTLITQDVSDVLESPMGEAIVTNAALQILMRQAPQAVPRLAQLFRLTPTEQSWLLNASRGEGLILCRGKRVPFQLTASREEERLIRAGENHGVEEAA